MFFHFRARFTLFTLLVLVFFSYGCSRERGGLQTAPDFSLPDLSGGMVSLSQFKDSIIVLDFWATWCPPCRLSIPELVDLQEKYGDQKVVILGISMDDPYQFNNNYLLSFKEKFKINYRILRVDVQVLQDYFGTLNVALPTLFVINREGKIVNKYVGYAPGVVEKSLKELL